MPLTNSSLWTELTTLQKGKREILLIEWWRRSSSWSRVQVSVKTRRPCMKINSDQQTFFCIQGSLASSPAGFINECGAFNAAEIINFNITLCRHMRRVSKYWTQKLGDSCVKS